MARAIRCLILLLFAVPAMAGDEKTFTLAEVTELARKLEGANRMQFDEYVNELRELDSQNKELRRKLEILTMRKDCA